MILISTMNITRTLERGEFYCPQCGTLQNHRLRSRRTFLTLYFIPTVPISAAEPFVQCDACTTTWDPTVLEMDRHAHEKVRESQFRDEAIRAAVLVTLENDDISESEIESLLAISDLLLEYPINREELGRLCGVARDLGVELENYVTTVSPRWTVSQRLLALQAIFLAATAGDNELSSTKLSKLQTMRDLLELSETEFQAAIDDALAYDRV
ncbi:MAG: zinc ribbon domain-containing protein [Planctomycetota bacterium]